MSPEQGPMTDLEWLREMRRKQGVRVASASRGKRDRELALYQQIDDRIRAIAAEEEEAVPLQRQGGRVCR
jgi:hypothetical protein